MKLLILLLISSSAFAEETTEEFRARFMTSTLGWVKNRNPRIEVSGRIKNRHGFGAIWAGQKIHFFNEHKVEYFGGFYQYTKEVSNARLGLVHAKKHIHRNIIFPGETEYEKKEGYGFMFGYQARYNPFLKNLVFGHGVDVIFVDADGWGNNGKDFIIFDISLLEVGFQL